MNDVRLLTKIINEDIIQVANISEAWEIIYCICKEYEDDVVTVHRDYLDLFNTYYNIFRNMEHIADIAINLAETKATISLFGSYPRGIKVATV